MVGYVGGAVEEGEVFGVRGGERKGDLREDLLGEEEDEWERED